MSEPGLVEAAPLEPQLVEDEPVGEALEVAESVELAVTFDAPDPHAPVRETLRAALERWQEAEREASKPVLRNARRLVSRSRWLRADVLAVAPPPSAA